MHTLGDMKDREAWHAAVPGIAKSGTQLHNKKMNGAGEVRQSLDNFFKKFVFKEGHWKDRGLEWKITT